jgi:hypothetical protein
MEVLNDTSAALSARGRSSEEETELSRRTSVPTMKDKENPGVFTTKMGMAAQFSGPARLNVPEEEVIVVKKRESKPTEAEPSAQAKPTGISRPIPNLDDSFEDVEEIPFLDDGKPDAKANEEQEEKPVEHEDDPEIVIESKHGPPKSSAGRSSASQGDARSEHKDGNSNEEKEDGEGILRRNATHEDIYDELRKMKRASRSPREEEQGSEHNESRSSSFNDKKDKASSNSEESVKEQSTREHRDSRDRDDRDRDSSDKRDKSREKRRERRRSKQDEPKKIQAQVCCSLQCLHIHSNVLCGVDAVFQPQERALHPRPLARVCQAPTRVRAWADRQVLHREKRERAEQARAHLHAAAGGQQLQRSSDHVREEEGHEPYHLALRHLDEPVRL